MSAWGKDGNSKPKYLRGKLKDQCTAEASGWTAPAGGNGRPNAKREVLVVVRGITNAKPAPKPVAKPAPAPVPTPAPKPVVEKSDAEPVRNSISSLLGINKT